MHVVVTPTAGLVEPGNTRQRNVPAKRRRHGPVQQAAAGTAIVSGEVPDGNGMMWARRVENHKVLLPSRGSYSNLHPRSGRSRKNSTSCCLRPPQRAATRKRSGNHRNQSSSQREKKAATRPTIASKKQTNPETTTTTTEDSTAETTQTVC